MRVEFTEIDRILITILGYFKLIKHIYLKKKVKENQSVIFLDKVLIAVSK